MEIKNLRLAEMFMCRIETDGHVLCFFPCQYVKKGHSSGEGYGCTASLKQLQTKKMPHFHYGAKT